MTDRHLRFFTRREIEKLFYRAGFAIAELQLIPGLGYREWEQHGQMVTVSLGAPQIQGLRTDDAREFYVHGYIVAAVQKSLPDYGLTSIVIITHNQLEYTRQCVESILRFTDEPYEFVFVDNNSTDGTVEYLRTVPDGKLIVNDDNRGFPAAANQGILQKPEERHFTSVVAGLRGYKTRHTLAIVYEEIGDLARAEEQGGGAELPDTPSA